MQIEIFEKAAFSSENSDLDMLLDYSIEALKNKGVAVKRYDQALEPEYFEDLKGYKLPVIKIDGEILCAGAYDFTLIDNHLITGGGGCGGCSGQGCPKKSGSGCSGCPSQQSCQKKAVL